MVTRMSEPTPWKRPDRERRLFCQLEALETAVYVTEIAKKV